MLHPTKHKIQNKPNAIQVIMNIRRNQRSTTQQKQPLSHLKFEEEKSLLSLIEKSKDFTSIFTKHKRSQYSGYKQVNMNKSKIIRFEHEHREISRYQTPRKYQMNLKNIAKLRKRYSLEPSHFKQSARGHKNYFIQTLKPIEKVDDKELQICSDRKCQRQLKQIIREMKTSKHFSIQNNLIENDKIQEYTTQRQNKRVSTLIQNPFNQLYSSLHAQEKIKQTNKNNLKLSALKFKKGKKFQLKDNLGKKHSQIQFEQEKNGEEENLCGWESQSFYPKKNNDFFHGYGFKF